MKTHYCGRLKYVRKDGHVVEIFPGYPVCCGGERAMNIKASKMQTWHERLVDCQSCMKLMSMPKYETDAQKEGGE